MRLEDWKTFSINKPQQQLGLSKELNDLRIEKLEDLQYKQATLDDLQYKYSYNMMCSGGEAGAGEESSSYTDNNDCELGKARFWDQVLPLPLCAMNNLQDRSEELLSTQPMCD